MTRDDMFEEYFVTPHARDRYAERVGGVEPKYASPIIKAIIFEAIEAGRKAKRIPRWLGYTDERPKNRAPGRQRYVWDLHEQVCFILHERSFDHKKCWNVVTCLTRKRPGW